MPSKFPGVDPFIEGQRWKGFHSGFINAMWDRLVAELRPRYIVDVEESVYVAHDDDLVAVRLPDVSISDGDSDSVRTTSTAVVSSSVTVTLPVTHRIRQLHLKLIRTEDRELVTVIELLSPWNKTGKGREQYLEKREEFLSTSVNLVELDLLRGGQRLPVREKLPQADYYAFVCRSSHRFKAEVFYWTLKQPLPKIPIPLSPDEDECILDLQALFTTTFDRAGYDYSLNYNEDVVPSFGEAESLWADELLHPRA